MHLPNRLTRGLSALPVLVTLTSITLPLGGAEETSGHSDRSRFSDQPAPLRIEDFPERPAPIVEIGDHFLGNGNLNTPFRLPTGAYWHPSFIMYGTMRTAAQSFDRGPGARSTEWVNRLDLFGNLQLAATERVVVGLRPFDQDGRFTGYRYEPDARKGWEDELNADVRTLFFEGEFGEIFPGLDDNDRVPLDIGISVGRQPFRMQDGLIVEDDAMDLIALTKNSLLPSGTSTLRISGIFGWNEIDRNNNREEKDAYFFGLNSQWDTYTSTWEADIAYVLSENRTDGFYAGVGRTRRIGKVNNTIRVVTSVAVEDESAAVRTGTLIFNEFSYTPWYGHDLIYLTTFWGIDDYSSAVRAPPAGGPLGRTGLSFAAVGIGSYGAPLGNRPERSVGGGLGYQMFFGELRRTQAILEIGGRTSTDQSGLASGAVSARMQHAVGRRIVLIADGFGVVNESLADGFGGRFEVLVKF
jgi:hypothetical protein